MLATFDWDSFGGGVLAGTAGTVVLITIAALVIGWLVISTGSYGPRR